MYRFLVKFTLNSSGLLALPPNLFPFCRLHLLFRGSLSLPPITLPPARIQALFKKKGGGITKYCYTSCCREMELIKKKSEAFPVARVCNFGRFSPEQVSPNSFLPRSLAASADWPSPTSTYTPLIGGRRRQRRLCSETRAALSAPPGAVCLLKRRCEQGKNARRKG